MQRMTRYSRAGLLAAILLLAALAACGVGGEEPAADWAEPAPEETGAPVVQYFYAEEASEGCFSLYWEVSDAESVLLDGEGVDNPGWTEVCPEEAAAYTLEAENEQGYVAQDLDLSPGSTTLPTAVPPPPPAQPPGGAIVIDHTCTDISQIPPEWLERARQLTLHYAHTSHGSQIVTGLEWLERQDPRLNVAVRYCGDDAGLPGEPGALRICDGNPPGGDYITPEDYWSTSEGLERTRAVADTGQFHFSMWSWCGEQSDNDLDTVQRYLETLSQLEQEYPSMRFLYMTGHTDGDNEILERNNEWVRQYVREHGGILFDFADIERYDPAGTYYPDADDSCLWCDDWCDAHPQDCAGLDQIEDCAHTHPLQCRLKGQAFWWMMARLAGWEGR